MPFEGGTPVAPAVGAGGRNPPAEDRNRTPSRREAGSPLAGERHGGLGEGGGGIAGGELRRGGDVYLEAPLRFQAQLRIGPLQVELHRHRVVAGEAGGTEAPADRALRRGRPPPGSGSRASPPPPARLIASTSGRRWAISSPYVAMSTPRKQGWRKGGAQMRRCTSRAPARRRRPTICSCEVPRTMLSSTTTTRLPLRTSGRGLYFSRAEVLRMLSSGWMKVRWM